MSELERQVVEGEVIHEEDFPYEGQLESYDQFVQALISEEQQITPHRWHQARICSMAVGRFERGTVKDLARKWGKHTNTVYDYAKAWRLKTSMEELEDYGQPETLGHSAYVVATYDPNPPEVLAIFEDKALTQPEQKALVAKRKEDAAEAEFGTPERSTPEKEQEQWGAKEDYHKEKCSDCKGRGWKWVRVINLEPVEYEEDAP